MPFTVEDTERLERIKFRYDISLHVVRDSKGLLDYCICSENSSRLSKDSYLRLLGLLPEETVVRDFTKQMLVHEYPDRTVYQFDVGSPDVVLDGKSMNDIEKAYVRPSPPFVDEFLDYCGRIIPEAHETEKRNFLAYMVANVLGTETIRLSFRGHAILSLDPRSSEHNTSDRSLSGCLYRETYLP